MKPLRPGGAKSYVLKYRAGRTEGTAAHADDWKTQVTLSPSSKRVGKRSGWRPASARSLTATSPGQPQFSALAIINHDAPE